MRVTAAKVSEIKQGSGHAVEIEGRSIAIFNVQGQFFAVDNSCSHMGAPLASGMLAGKTVTCEWHGACFSLETGAAENAPARGDIRAYKVFVVDEDIEIEID